MQIFKRYSKQVVGMLQRLPKGEAVTDLVRRLLAGELCNGEPTLEEIVPRLHLSERRLAIDEIAFLPGFSEPSAFNRAFKRWTGHAPLGYRQLSSVQNLSS